MDEMKNQNNNAEQNVEVEKAEQQPAPERLTGAMHSPAVSENMRNYALAVYILYAVSIVVGITAIVGVVIAYIKRDEMAGTIYYDHMQYLIKTFWIALAGSVIGWITSFIGIGLIVLLIVGLWFIYRVVVGFIKFNDNQPISVEGWL